MLVVNLFAGSGAGKSTTAAGVFHALKRLDINCELVTEYAKELVWEESYKTLQDQLLVFATQNHRLKRLENKVDVVVTDSPILLSLFYNTAYVKEGVYGEKFEECIREVFNSYNNLNYFLIRKKKYNPVGRLQTEDEAKELDSRIYEMLDREDIEFYELVNDETAVGLITKNILRRI